MSTVRATNFQNAGSANVNMTLDTSGNAIFAGMVDPGYSFMRNKIINGDMRIDQRNAGSAVTVNSTSAQYPVDRFYGTGQSTDGVYTAQRVADGPTGFTNSLKVTVTTADASLGATQTYGLAQIIEGLNIADLAWGSASALPVTLSFWVKSSLTGTFAGSLTNSGNNRAYVFTYNISNANTWEYKTVAIAGDTSGTWLTDTSTGIAVRFALGVGATYTGTANTWTGSLILSATGSTNVMATLNATWQITGVQLESGTIATPFERRLYGQELALCQRYYEVGGRNGWIGYSSGAGNSVIGWAGYRVTKRAAATITIPSYATQSVNSASPYSNTTDGFEINGTTSATASAAYVVTTQWSASSEL